MSSGRFVLAAAALLATASGALAQGAPEITEDWSLTLRTSRTTPTLQIVVNPKLMPGQAVEKGAYDAVRKLGASYVRYVPWYPYPKLVVPELDAPTAAGTSWDFKLIDPMTLDFLGATKGKQGMLNFSTIPVWMFKTDKPMTYPSDVNQTMFTYNQGLALRDPSGREVGDYFARIVSWYAKGGFTDEKGVRHTSNYHYDIPFWEVLNEPDVEHFTTPQDYVKRYDAITAAIHKVSPDTKFVGISVARNNRPDYFEYFLNPRNHAPGAPLDWISYHFYAQPDMGQTINDLQYSFFQQADWFLFTVAYNDAIRQRLAPQVKTTINEIGSILPTDRISNRDHDARDPHIPQAYWNLSGALYAYLYMQTSKMGIDVVGESQLVGYPTQYPSVTMVDWNTGAPNARFRVLELLKNNFGPGDRIIGQAPLKPGPVALPSTVVSQAYVHNGQRKLLLVNKRLKDDSVTLPADAVGGQLQIVDMRSASTPARTQPITGRTIPVGGFAVIVVDYPSSTANGRSE